MDRPKVFISSTIYDFADLRSALKYWLNETGYNAQLSEYNDFLKDASVNSYEACLQSVSKCNYFILLIGTRKGGMYPNESISITRKEYRTAYELAKSGKIKKLLIFIRQSVWDIKEDRKALHNLLKDLTILENEKPFDKKSVEFYNSSLLKDAEHIIDFIDEVTRKKEAREGVMPPMNWVHTFSTYEDIINTIKAELKINSNLSVQIAEQNIKMALVHNLQKITIKTESGRVFGFYLSFGTIRDKLLKFREENEQLSLEKTICLTNKEVHSISDFFLFFRNGVDELNIFEFENVLSSGIFLSFDSSKHLFVYNDFTKMLYQIMEETRRLKRFVSEFSYEAQDRLLNIIPRLHQRRKDLYEFKFIDLALINAIYERLINIQNISSYLIQYIHQHNKSLKIPAILNGLINSERPDEQDILNIFEC